MKTWGLAAALSLSLGSTGCLAQLILDGQIASTRKASVVVDTIPDFEIANTIAFSAIAQAEGFHYLAPDNENALFMLTRSWTGLGSAFIEDQLEIAEDLYGSDSPEYVYHQTRARAAYDRAIYYGTKLVEKRVTGFEQARINDETLRGWLKKFNDPEKDAPNLFWFGYAWIARTSVMKDEPAFVGDLYIGVAIVERAVELDEKYAYGLGHVVLGSYHARAPMAELDDAKKHFDKALAITEGKALMPKFQLAARYYCMKGDKESYEKTLNEVLDAGDTMPQQRLQNSIAKRKARRYLEKSRMRGMCGF